MCDKPKKELSEKQKEVLEKNSFKNKPRAERCELAAKGAHKTNQIKQEKIEREKGNIIAWDEFFGTKEQLKEFWNSLSPKDKKDVFLHLLPPDKQTNEIIGSLGFEKIFITQEEKKATDKHIDDIINDGIAE